MCGQLAVLLDGLLIVRNCLLGCFHALLGLPNSGSCHVQLLTELQLCLPRILLQLIIHLVHCFLDATKLGEGTGRVRMAGPECCPYHNPCSKVKGLMSVFLRRSLPNTLHQGQKSGTDSSLTKSPTVSRSSRTFSSRFRFRSVSISTISSAPSAASTCVKGDGQGEVLL